jgi:hypothetical protein
LNYLQVTGYFAVIKLSLRTVALSPGSNLIHWNFSLQPA